VGGNIEKIHDSPEVIAGTKTDARGWHQPRSHKRWKEMGHLEQGKKEVIKVGAHVVLSLELWKSSKTKGQKKGSRMELILKRPLMRDADVLNKP